MVRDVVELLRSALAGGEDLVVPKRDAASVAGARPDLDDSGRTEGVVEELLGAAPYDLDRLARLLGEACGFDSLLPA
jgi:hypothetical protein